MDALTKAARQLRREREVLMLHVVQIDKVLSAMDGRGRTGRKKMSVAARKRISAAQKLRWKKARAEK